MSNQTLQALAVIKKRLDDKGYEKVTFSEILELNKIDVEFLAKKFQLANEEALFLAASCLYVVERYNIRFDFTDVADVLRIDNIQALLYQNYFKSLIEKGFLVEIPKEDCYHQGHKSVVEMMTKDFVFHSSFGNNFD